MFQYRRALEYTQQQTGLHVDGMLTWSPKILGLQLSSMTHKSEATI